VWQVLREELHPKGLEIVTVGLDSVGAEACRPFIEAAQPVHPSLVDPHHLVAELFGVIQVPNGVWIDEDGVIVRPAETSPAPPVDRVPMAGGDVELPQRLTEIFGEASHIETQPEDYLAALRDWVEKGAASEFALSPEEVIARSRPRTADIALGQAHFELATELEKRGSHEAAVRYFREAHRLFPHSWTYRRQAWSLEREGDGPLARFWQGPLSDDPESWPYEGDWLRDIREAGAANYYEPWVP
jgi:hypothetical protein